jgi:hypothetical protein
LHAPPPPPVDLVLVFGCYRRQTGALFSPLRYKVLLALENIPAHVWSLEIAQAVVGSSCLIFVTSPTMANGAALLEFWAVVWATHPDLIPAEVGSVFLEPEKPFVERAPPLFLSASEIIHSKRDTLQLRVLIKVVEVHDFTNPIDSNNDASDSNDDFIEDGLLGPSPSLSTSLRPWLRIFRIVGESSCADGY